MTAPPAPATRAPATGRQLVLSADAAAGFGLACVTVDATGVVEEMNAEAEALFGRRASRCVGRPLDALHEGLRDTEAVGRLTGAIRNQVSDECRITVPLLGVNLLARVVPMTPSGAAVFFRVAQPMPGTATADLRLRQVVDALSDIVSITAPDGTLLYLNQAGRDLLGITSDGADGTTALFPTHTPAARELLLTEAVPAALRFGRWMGDTALQAADGRVFPATQTILAHRDAEGEVTSLSTVIRDVSVERHASIALRESQRLFEVIARSTPDLLFLFDPAERRIVWTNRCLAAWLGGEERDHRSFDFDQIRVNCHPDDLPALEAHIERLRLALGDGEIFANELRLRGPDGGWRWLYARDSVFTRDERGHPLLILGVVTDITEQRAAEDRLREAHDAADAANRAKSAFLARMSHELRTPLNSVIGFSSQLLRNRAGALSERETLFLQRVRANGMHLLQIVSDILDHTAIESGDLSIKQGMVDVRDVVAEAERDARQLIGSRALALAVQVPDHPVPLLTDFGRLQQVLHHLLTNAVKFTPAGGRITLTLEADPSGTPRRLLVADTGVGIPGPRQSRIFEAFEHSDNIFTRTHDGTGLGLAVARGLAELLGCRLSLQSSTPGVGTTFELTFPQPGRAAAIARLLEARAAATQSPRRILVADDNPEARRIQGAILAEAGYEVRSAASGLEALQVARSWRPDAITLDLVMPTMDGRQVLTELKADVTLRHIPVVVVTMRCPSAVDAPGAAAVVAKPVDPDRLLAAVGRAQGELAPI